MDGKLDIDLKKITLENVDSCPLCASVEQQPCFVGHDTLYHSDGEWPIVRCSHCHFMFVTPRPDTDSIGQFYPDDYKPYSVSPSIHAPSRLRQFAKNSFKRIFNSYEVVIPRPANGGSALEVGCASGRNLIQLHQSGWQVFGLEPSNSAVESLSRLDYVDAKQGTISSANYSSNSFDLILASMVLEHLHHPRHDVEKIFQWLKPGGYLSGSVPNSASWEFNYFKGEWYGLHLPHHLCHFTPDTLTSCLEASGFTKITIYQQRNMNNLMVHLGRWFAKHKIPGAKMFLNYPERAPWWLRCLCHLPAALLAWTSQSGRISFTAQKPHD